PFALHFSSLLLVLHLPTMQIPPHEPNPVSQSFATSSFGAMVLNCRGAVQLAAAGVQLPTQPSGTFALLPLVSDSEHSRHSINACRWPICRRVRPHRLISLSCIGRLLVLAQPAHISLVHPQFLSTERLRH